MIFKFCKIKKNNTIKKMKYKKRGLFIQKEKNEIWRIIILNMTRFLIKTSVLKLELTPYVD